MYTFDYFFGSEHKDAVYKAMRERHALIHRWKDRDTETEREIEREGEGKRW
jgi:hypothetical protein